MSRVVPIQEFAKICFEMLKSDRDVTIGVGGFTGEGKSTFSTKLQKSYAKISGTKWDFSHMTWSREELMMWIDGKGENREGQMPEFTAILPDELISMFYKRSWYDDPQKAAVEVFNKCRDRHLLICGNIPDFWDLDSGFITRVRFYVYIPRRGIAWVFEQENNPFTKDKWNRNKNVKLFRKNRVPYKLPNFLFEIHFDDWDPEEKERYYKIRNTKRRNTEGQNKKNKPERYKDIKIQRDKLVRFVWEYKDSDMMRNINQKAIAEIMDLEPATVNYIIHQTQRFKNEQ